MKPYFAKYLPVEGEIKDGDLIWNPKKPLQRPWIAVTPGNYNNPHVSYWDGHTKVELFLCSRDIQVDDEVYCWDSSGNNHQLNDFGTVLALEYGGIKIKPKNKTQDYIRYSKEEVVNIIGEISPDATWVKEGDEFDESEVRFFYKSEDNYHFLPYDSHHKLLIDANLKIKRGELIVEIKGPCGHFH